MTLNLTELRDEPLGKHPSQANICVCGTCVVETDEAQQDVVAADDESSFTFDVEGLGDEALDDSPPVSSLSCVFYCGLSDEALDDSPSVSAAAVCVICWGPCYVDGLADEALDPRPHVSAFLVIVRRPHVSTYPVG